MRTGCRCRKTFDSITSTRLRSLSGRPCRNTDVQTCVSVSQFQNRVPGPSCGATVLVSAMFVGGRPFEVNAGRAEAAAVARALELVLGRQIVRRAAEVRAGDAERVEAAGVLI